MDRTTRRRTLTALPALAVGGIAGCLAPGGDGESPPTESTEGTETPEPTEETEPGGGTEPPVDAPETVLTEGFEDGVDPWERDAAIGPEQTLDDFERSIERSDERASEGDWSLRVFTEGNHDDGTAWVVRRVELPPADRYEVTVDAWSESESFNTLRYLVASLAPERPEAEADFPDPGENTTGVEDAPAGGLREVLHRAEGWEEYVFEWEPAEPPEEAYLAVGVTVVWEADATHFVDAIRVRALS